MRVPFRILCAGIFTLALQSLSAQPIPPLSTQNPTLRIGLFERLAGAKTLLVTCAAPFKALDSSTNDTLIDCPAGAVYQIRADGSSVTIALGDGPDAGKPLTLSSPVEFLAGPNDALAIANGDLSQPKWTKYRGQLTLQLNGHGALLAINTVPLEQYLYGVVPAEIGGAAPLEAMEAQAVAARTYALKNMGRFAASGFDLDDTTRCEGYVGLSGETAAADNAVNATSGQVIAWRNQLIDALYSTDSGGMTACDDTGQCPYFQAVRDAPADGPDYGADDKFHVWSWEVSPAQLQSLLDKDPRTNIGSLQSLALNGFDASGRIESATATGTDGSQKTVTGPELRMILGPNALRSTLAQMSRQPNGDYLFSGKGWGHGFGMSQDGAVAMASPPFDCTYRQILAHYYVGTELVQADSPLLDQPGPIASAAERSNRFRRGS